MLSLIDIIMTAMKIDLIAKADKELQNDIQ